MASRLLVAHAVRKYASILALAVLAGCANTLGDAAPEPDVPAYRGDALIVRVVTDAAAAHGVPRDVLLALGWAETRLVPRTGELPPGANDADELGDDHEGEGAICGLFGLDEGSAREEAAALVSGDPALLCGQAELEANAAAARLRSLAGGDDAPPLDDTRAWLDALDEWHPALADASFPYGEYIARVMSLGFRGEDEVGAAIYLPPVDGLVDPATLSTSTEDGDVGAALGYARPDTSLAEWRGPACDYARASRGRGDIRFVVIHTCEGGFAGCLSTLRSCGGSVVSAHYVTSYTGYSAQLVEENDVAWHVGCLNGSSIGIEHEGFAGSTTHPDAQLCRTARIVRSICDRYGIPRDRSHIIGHVEANRLYCHGSHWDPGPHWDWTKFMSYVNHGCGCVPHAESCNGRDDDCDGRVDDGVTNRCGTCGAVPTETCNGRDDDCDGTIDENVCDRADASGDALPEAIDLGTTVHRTITFRNTGTTTWRPAHYRVVARGSGASVSLEGGIESAVAPGERVSVELSVGPSAEDALSVTVEVQRDGSGIAHAWHGASRGQRPAFAARFLDVSAPMVLDAGAWGDGYATVENAGREAFPFGTHVDADTDGPIQIRDSLIPMLEPGESARVAVHFGAADVRVETMASATLVVRDADGTTAGWPDPGRHVEIGIAPSHDAPAGPAATPAPDATLLGGCSAAPSHGGSAPWALVIGVALFAFFRSRRSRGALALGAALALSGCTGALCDSDAACALELTSMMPHEGSARGGELVTIEGLGLERTVGVRFGDRPAALLARTEERLSVRTPVAVAGTVDVVIELDDGGERVWPAAFTFAPLALAFDEVEDALPEDTLEQRDAASADFDGDGDLDLFVVVRNGAPRLYLNDGEGAFELAPEGTLDAPEIDAVGVAAGDVDADGDVDVFVPVYGQGADLLLRNEGGRLVADASALPTDATSDHAAALGDLDRDGDLDLVVAQSGRDAEMRMAERVLLNDGEGTFAILEDAIADVDDRTTGVALGDLDGDGVLDLVTANDGEEDVHLRLLRGQGDGTFADAEAGALPSPPDRSRRPLLGDLDGDGDLDLVAIGRGQDHLFINDGAGHFYDATFLTMPTDDGLGFGGALADVDLDGDADVVVANSGTASRLLVNEGGHMRDASLLLPAEARPTRQVLVLDADAEGAPDLAWIEGPDARSHVSFAVRVREGEPSPPGVSRDALTVTSGCSIAGPARGGRSLIVLALVVLAALALRRKRIGLAAALLFAGCAAPAPTVDAMTPATLSARGGERLELRGSDLDLADVRIGGVTASVLERSSDALVVETPPLTAGLVEIELLWNERRAWTGELTIEPLPVRFSVEDVSDDLAARHVHLADLDGDGDLDAAVALRDRLATIFLNDDGQLAEARELLPAELAGQAMDLAIGDLSEDGRPDLYIVTGAGEPDRVLVQATNGSFLEIPDAVPSELAQTTGVALADLDDDGRLDVVTARWRLAEDATEGTTGVRVLRNEGSARFADVTPELPGLASDPSFGVAVADFDGDEREDIFVANAGAPSRLLIGTGRARFLPKLGAIPETAWDARTPEAADVDDDGDLDLVIPTLGRDVLLRNDGGGRFGDATRFAMGAREAHTESITVCDLDRDGDVDLLGAGYGSPDNVLDLSDDARWFVDYAGRLSMLPEATEVRFAAGDLDADGDPDLVLASTGAPLRVLRHHGGAPPELHVIEGVRYEPTLTAP